MIIRKVYNTGVLCHDGSSIDYQIEGLAEHLVDLLRVAIEAFVRLCNAGGDDGMIQCSHEGEGDSIIGDPDPDGLLIGEHDLGDQFGGLQDKGIGPWYECFHDPVGVIRDMGILADVLEVRADDAETFTLMVFL